MMFQRMNNETFKRGLNVDEQSIKLNNKNSEEVDCKKDIVNNANNYGDRIEIDK